jgi:hypothetical protein
VLDNYVRTDKGFTINKDSIVGIYYKNSAGVLHYLLFYNTKDIQYIRSVIKLQNKI